MTKVEWLQSEPTKNLIQKAKEQLRDLETRFANGASLQKTSDETALVTARFVGLVNGINWMLEEIMAKDEPKPTEEDENIEPLQDYPENDGA